MDRGMSLPTLKLLSGTLLIVFMTIFAARAGEEDCLGSSWKWQMANLQTCCTETKWGFSRENGPSDKCANPMQCASAKRNLRSWGKPPIKCFECSTNDPDSFCSDPFNKTHPDVQLITCTEYCVKWTRNTLSGKIYVQRTCSSNLQISMRKNVVCIQESRPSSGQICFCDKDECNVAATTSASFLTLTSLLAFTYALFGEKIL